MKTLMGQINNVMGAKEGLSNLDMGDEKRLPEGNEI